MFILIAAVGTILLFIWIGLMFSIQNADWQASAYYKVVMNQNEISKLEVKEQKNKMILENYFGVSKVFMSLIYQADYSKEIKKLRAASDQMKKRNFKKVSIVPTCGHVMLRQMPQIRNSSFYHKLMVDYIELYGRKHASRLCDHLIAMMISLFFLGLGVTLLLGVGMMALGETGTGGLVTLVGVVLVFVTIYALYDETKDQVQKRRDIILRQFPNIVSKLALLVTSGMIMDRAWKETAFSKEDELYQEMRLTSLELENLVQPEIAYGNFINRCHTKETSKLASAIMQNLSKGNSEIGKVLKEMAADAWQERRHLAKRDSEEANAKMMIPTMMLFMTILGLILVPIAMNFSTF